MIEQIGNQKARAFRNLELAFFFVLLVLQLISCTTIDPSLTGESGSSSFEEKLNGLVNIMTYDQALMTWGEPASVFEGDEIFIATWGNKQGGGAVFPIGNTWFAMPIENGWKLQLSFNKMTRKMVSWKHERW